MAHWPTDSSGTIVPVITGSVDLIPATSLAGGTKTVAAAATPEKLVATSTPCRAVWIGAPCDGDGAATNTKPIFIGDSAGQNIPIMANDFEGLLIEVDDASKVYIKVGVNGESAAYRILA